MIGMLRRLSVSVVDALHVRHPEIDMAEVDNVFSEVLAAERDKSDV